MFGLSKKERAAEALKRGTLAALTGGFLHHSEIESMGINKHAAAWVFGEALAHQMYALWIAYTNSIGGEHDWATPQFFNDCVAGALHEGERSRGLRTGSYSFVFSRLEEFQKFSGQDLIAGAHFLLSATEARRHDANANVAAIEEKLNGATEQYFQAAWKMFST